MSERFVTVGDDWIRYRFPHPKVLRYIRSYFHTYRHPHFYRCDPVVCDIKKGPHSHFTWAMLLRGIVRLVFRGSYDTRWD